jgi:hypothetical protein
MDHNEILPRISPCNTRVIYALAFKKCNRNLRALRNRREFGCDTKFEFELKFELCLKFGIAPRRIRREFGCDARFSAKKCKGDFFKKFHFANFALQNARGTYLCNDAIAKISSWEI